MKAVFVVDDSKVAKILIDPMRRAILELMREKPMTQTEMANELGLTAASLNYHINLLKSKKLVSIAKRKVENHGIVQIYFSSCAYLFVYDLKSLPQDISRYFYPIALERMRAVLSVLMMYKDYDSNNPQKLIDLANIFSDYIVAASLPYVKKEVLSAKDSIIFDIYVKAVKNLIRSQLSKTNKEN